jgi:hypothetical protein
MNKITIILILLLLWLSISAVVSAQTRDIYIGDIITVNITTDVLSAEDLVAAFYAFEIVSMKNTYGGYEVSVRTFDIGEHRVQVGDIDLLITVNSTLDAFDRDTLFEGEAGLMPVRFPYNSPVNLRLLFFVFLGISVFSGMTSVILLLKKRRIKQPDPYRFFMQQANALSTENADYLVDLTSYFKEYIESLYSCAIKDKTTDEVIRQLNGIHELLTVLPEINAWLSECDRLKFTGVAVTPEEMKAHYADLLRIVERINI